MLTTTLADPDGGGSLTSPVTSYTWDNLGRMLSLADPDDNRTSWVYDLFNRQTIETNELSDARTFSYDAGGNVVEKVDRNGRVSVYEYDGLARMIAERWMVGLSVDRTLEFEYDAGGNLLSASDPAAEYGYNYDRAGRVEDETQDIAGLNPEIAYAMLYNAAGYAESLSAMIGANDDFENTYGYDAAGHLTQILQAGQSGGNAVATKRVDIDYNSVGQFSQIRRWEDASATLHAGTTNYGYDLGRIAKITHHSSVQALASGTSWGSDILAGYQYTYDNAWRMTSIDSYLDGLSEFSYDNTDQLTAADHDVGITDEAYSYDANGNRLYGVQAPGDLDGLNNRLATDGVYNYTFDDEGNLVLQTEIATGDKREFSWDYRNRLIKVTFKDDQDNVLKTIDYVYDVFDRLIRRTLDADGPGGSAASDQFFSFLGASINPHLQLDGPDDSDLSHRYLWGPAVDQLLADERVSDLESEGDILWALSDHLGTPRDIAMRDSLTGDVEIVNSRQYNSFGVPTGESNGAFSILWAFTGKLYDPETGMQLHWKRWYITSLGIWASEDPKGFVAGDTNLLRYVSNSPITSITPLGVAGHAILNLHLDLGNATAHLPILAAAGPPFYDPDPPLSYRYNFRYCRGSDISKASYARSVLR
jgi:RHS repeat-associated protein